MGRGQKSRDLFPTIYAVLIKGENKLGEIQKGKLIKILNSCGFPSQLLLRLFYLGL